MIRILLACAFLLLPVAAHAQMEQQQLVDRATLTVQDIMGLGSGAPEPVKMLRKARAVMICPRVFRAGFIFGGQGGDCVLVARDGAGSWSYPAFYGMGAGSVGFQAGIQDAEIMMMIMSQRGLAAVIDDQFKIGADASVAFINLGGGVEGSTTSAAGADIVAFARTRGLFAGVSLEGSLMGAKSNWNQIYYGQPFATQQVVMQMQAHNAAADPLRAVLMRYNNGAPMAPPPAQDNAPLAITPQPSAGVERQSLPPPGR